MSSTGKDIGERKWLTVPELWEAMFYRVKWLWYWVEKFK